MADTLSQGAGALASNFDKTGVASDLVEGGQGALRFGKQFSVELGFKLKKGVVDAETVIFHAALQQHQQLLLARKALEDLEELRGRSA